MLLLQDRMGIVVTAGCFSWGKNSKFTAFLLFRQALWTLKYLGIQFVFALSTSKELEKLIENRQIQDWVSAGIIGDLQALVTSLKGVGFKDGIKLLYEYLLVLCW